MKANTFVITLLLLVAFVYIVDAVGIDDKCCGDYNGGTSPLCEFYLICTAHYSAADCDLDGELNGQTGYGTCYDHSVIQCTGFDLNLDMVVDVNDILDAGFGLITNFEDTISCLGFITEDLVIDGIGEFIDEPE